MNLLGAFVGLVVGAVVALLINYTLGPGDTAAFFVGVICGAVGVGIGVNV